MAGQDRAGCRADSRTIQVGTDALDQFGHHVLGEAGVGTCSAGLRTVETRLFAFGQLREIKLTPQSFGWDSNICTTCDMAISYGWTFSRLTIPGRGIY